MKRVEEEFMKSAESEGVGGGESGATLPSLMGKKAPRNRQSVLPFSSSSSILVPSPALSMTTPLLGSSSQENEDEHDSDTEDSVSSVDDAQGTVAKSERKSGSKTAGALPVSARHTSVPGHSDSRIVILSAPHDVQGVTTVGRGAGL